MRRYSVLYLSQQFSKIEKLPSQTVTTSSYRFFWYSLGEMPKWRLNVRVKCWG